MAHTFKLYDSLRREVLPFVPHEPGLIRMYVCGMTVYDHAHVGHARAMVIFDAFVRYLRLRGWRVLYARNYTDIDDKIIARAQGEDPLQLAQRYIDAFDLDMRALGLSPADLEPRVSRSIPQIVEMIQRLIDRGYAYVSEGDVWFEVSRFERYGALSGQRLDKLQSSPDSGGGKRDSRDFALWKAAKPGEPAWSTPWGEGRPGWHIECSAMSRAALGGPIDIHGGGLDLCFPHHENEIAQSECAHEGRYASYWMHNGLLTTEAGNKIARSLGNGDTIREVLQRAPAEALRLYYLQAHYRSGLPWNDQALSSAICKLARLYEALEAAEALRTDAPVPERAPEGLQQALSLAVDFEAQLYAALDHDFNTACALGRAFELVRAFNHARSTVRSKKKLGPLARLVHEGLSLLPRTLGILSQRPETFERTVKRMHLGALGLDEGYVQSRLTARERARAARDYPQADAIREELAARQLEILDTPKGPRWRVVM